RRPLLLPLFCPPSPLRGRGCCGLRRWLVRLAMPVFFGVPSVIATLPIPGEVTPTQDSTPGGRLLVLIVGAVDLGDRLQGLAAHFNRGGVWRRALDAVRPDWLGHVAALDREQRQSRGGGQGHNGLPHGTIPFHTRASVTRS